MKNFVYKIIAFVAIFILSSSIVCNDGIVVEFEIPTIEPLYNNIWGTIYHAEVRQCDDTPTITGDGSKINPYKASEHRWIAISQEMLDSQMRVKLLNDSTSALYKGKIEYGDTVWIESSNEAINGWWVVHDTKNKRYRNSIDFLQTKGDGTLYNNDSMWNGRFDSIKIYNYNRSIHQSGWKT